MTVAIAAVAPAAPATAPTPTVTAEPRLTGGFGKTPVPGTAGRRHTEKKEIRITNDSLVTDPLKGKLTTSQRPPTPPPTETGKRTPGAVVTPTTPTEAVAAAAQPEGGEAYWRAESRRLRERVFELREAIVRLENDTKRLEADFYSWDDGAYRDRVIKPAWDKAREDLTTARRELPLAERALEELPDRARRSGALPGWLRE
jgi:hypothetical protein